MALDKNGNELHVGDLCHVKLADDWIQAQVISVSDGGVETPQGKTIGMLVLATQVTVPFQGPGVLHGIVQIVPRGHIVVPTEGSPPDEGTKPPQTQ